MEFRYNNVPVLHRHFTMSWIQRVQYCRKSAWRILRMKMIMYPPYTNFSFFFFSIIILDKSINEIHYKMKKDCPCYNIVLLGITFSSWIPIVVHTSFSSLYNGANSGIHSHSSFTLHAKWKTRMNILSLKSIDFFAALI